MMENPLTDGSDRVKRVCVVRLGGMGDILLATPAVRAVAQRFGTTEIDYIVGRGMRDALTGIPYLRRVIEFDKGGDDARPRNFVAFLSDLRRQKYDLFLNFHPSVKTVAMAVASGAPRVITFQKDRRKQPDTGRVRHAVDDFTKELKPLGILRVEDRRMDFFIPDEARATVAALLEAEGISPADTLLVVNPAATRDINRWPPEKFVAFMDAFAEAMPDVRLVLSGGPGDVDLAGGIAEKTRARVLNLAGKIKVKELGALLARANTVLTADTGPMHIASAVGAPLVVLSGAADPDRTGPLSPRDLVVINRELPCVPCQDRFCRRGDIACMTQLPVEWTMRAVMKRLGEPGEEKGIKAPALPPLGHGSAVPAPPLPIASASPVGEGEEDEVAGGQWPVVSADNSPPPPVQREEGQTEEGRTEEEQGAEGDTPTTDHWPLTTAASGVRAGANLP